jgi:hypothetical protein
MPSFCSVVSGFVNASAIVEKFGDKQKITSNSLRSLCKTVLSNTNPMTASAADRSKVVVNILSAVLPGDAPGVIETSNLRDMATLVSTEETELRHLKDMLGTQGTLRPIFEGQLRQRRSVRERAMGLRKMVAEAGLDYKAVAELYESGSSDLKPVLKSKLPSGAADDDVDELVVLFDQHFRPRIMANGTHNKEASPVSEH